MRARLTERLVGPGPLSNSSAPEDDRAALGARPSRPGEPCESVHPEGLALLAEGVRKSFGATQALKAAQIDVRRGEVHGLVGANGAGKSTLVKTLSGVHRPDAGTLGIGVWRGASLTPRQAQQLGLATIYQDADIAPTLGLAENVALGREKRRGGIFVARAAERAAAREALDRVGLPWSRRQRAGALKPADQQLLQIAKALHRAARVIIMDEPTAALGVAEVERLFTLIGSLRRDGVAVLYISHRLDEVLELCDRVTVMRDGCCVATQPASELDEDQLVQAMIGRDVERVEVRSSTRGPLALRTSALSQGQRLRDVDLELYEGEVVGVTGLVGSGRSRLARVIFGAEPYDGGEMQLYGRPYRPGSPAAAIARGIALVPEDRKRDSLLMNLAAGKNVTLARMVTRRFGIIRLGRERQVAAELLRRLAVSPPSPATLPARLSGGNQQKVSIARWLHIDPRVLIFDEPGQGVDIGAKEHILREIRRLAHEGRAVLVISEELDELAQVADRVLVMRAGRIAGEVSRESLTEGRILALAMGTAKDKASREVHR